MSIALSALRQRVKTEIHANYVDSVVLGSALSSTQASALFGVGYGDRLSRDVIQVDNEVMRIVEYPAPVSSMASALNSTDTYFIIDDVTSYPIGVSARLKVDNEIMSVSAVSANVYVSAERGVFGTVAASHANNARVFNADAARVIRGYQGTVASAHPVSSTANIVDVWSDTQVDQAIYDATRYMWPSLYQDFQVTTLASAYAVNSSQTHFTASMPSYVEYVGKIKVTDNSGVFQRSLVDFNLRQGGSDGAYVLEVNEIVNSGEYLWPYGAQRYEFDSSSVLNVPAYLEEFVTLYASKKLIEERLPEFVRFDKYSTRLNKEQGSRPDYSNILANYTQRISDILSHNAKSLDAQDIDFGQGV